MNKDLKEQPIQILQGSVFLRNSKCRGPKESVCTVCSRNKNEATKTEVERARRRAVDVVTEIVVAS